MTTGDYSLSCGLDRHLHAELERLRTLLSLRIGELQAQGILPASTDRSAGRVVRPSEIERRLERVRGLGAGRPVDDPVAEILESLPPEALLSRGELSPLSWVRQQCGLDTLSYWLLVCAAAPGLSADIARSYAFARDSMGRCHLSLRLFVELLGWADRPGAERVHGHVMPGSPLVDLGLVTVVRHETTRAVDGIIVADRILDFLTTPARSVHHSVASFCRLQTAPTREMDALILAPTTLSATQSARQALQDYAQDGGAVAPLILLSGSRGDGRRSVATVLGQAMGRGLLEIDCQLLFQTQENPRLGLQQALREAVLLGAWPALSHCELWLDEPEGAEEGEGQVDGSRQRFETVRSALARSRLPCFLSAPGDVHPREVEEKLGRGVTEVGFPPTDATRRLALWNRYLPERFRDDALDMEAIVSKYALAPGHIERVATYVVNHAVGDDGFRPVSFETLNEAVQAHVNPKIRSLARRITSRPGWDDLILDDENLILLHTLVNHFRHRRLVHDTWGVGSTSRHKGVAALFSGPSGTGKTLAATVVARQLGMEVLQVDLAAMVSKYIGETEKNLALIFDEAEACGAMILFDEADSLFGKRTKVSSSTDRYANMGTNYLLQRLESFDGVSILTTNLIKLIDEAFLRRIRFNISFAKPDQAMRQRLWETLMPASLPLDGEINFEKLSAQFEMTGGTIRNAVLQAAFFAADLDCDVDEELLFFAARLEMRSQGQLVRSVDIKSFFDKYRARPRRG